MFKAQIEFSPYFYLQVKVCARTSSCINLQNTKLSPYFRIGSWDIQRRQVPSQQKTQNKKFSALPLMLEGSPCISDIGIKSPMTQIIADLAG